MLWFKRIFGKINGGAAHREWMLALYGRLVDHTKAFSGSGRLGIEDGFPLRFEIMVLLVSAVLWHWWVETKNSAAVSQVFWDVTGEGFEESLRQRGVSDIRMAVRMRKLMLNAMGRRNAYFEAWQAASPLAIRQAVARNVLNGAAVEDPRVDYLLEVVENLQRESVPPPR